MKFSAKGIYIEATPEELALLLAPGECIPAMQDETEDGEKEINIHANIFMPPEMPDEVTFHMDNEPDANQNPVSDSDTKAGGSAKADDDTVTLDEARVITKWFAKHTKKKRGDIVKVEEDLSENGIVKQKLVFRDGTIRSLFMRYR